MILDQTREQHTFTVHNDNEKCFSIDENSIEDFNCSTVFQNDKNSLEDQCSHDANQMKAAHGGLNGDYWRTISKRRSSKTLSSDFREFLRLNRSMICDSDDSENEYNNSMNLLYRKNTLVACRNLSNSFYVCQLLEDVRQDSNIVRIRWYSVIGALGDVTTIEKDTELEPSYEDTLDPRAILMELSPVRSARPKIISLKHEDLIETRRLLKRSIRKTPLVHRKRKISIKEVTTINSKLKTFSNAHHIRFPSSDDESDVDVSITSIVTTKPTKTIVDSSSSDIKPMHIYFSSSSDDDIDAASKPARIQSKETRLNGSSLSNHNRTLAKRKKNKKRFD